MHFIYMYDIYLVILFCFSKQNVSKTYWPTGTVTCMACYYSFLFLLINISVFFTGIAICHQCDIYNWLVYMFGSGALLNFSSLVSIIIPWFVRGVLKLSKFAKKLKVFHVWSYTLPPPYTKEEYFWKKHNANIAIMTDTNEPFY